jgi:predicted flavoprotein YhiN
MKQIIIIGGGAAGFFCASNLDEKKYTITILEQNCRATVVKSLIRHIGRTLRGLWT